MARTRPPAAGVPRPRRVSPIARFAPAALVLLVGVIAYANSFSGVLVFDDVPSIAENAHIRSIASAVSTPPDTVTLAGRPVLSVSFALNYLLAPADQREEFLPSPDPGGNRVEGVLRNLRGYHAVNLAIHLLSALVLFAIARRTLVGGRFAGVVAEHAGPLALIVALIWVSHPLLTSAVTYVVQRAESLMGLFYLLTLYCAIRAWDERRSRAVSRAWEIAAIACCALGMGTKEAMVSAPIAVVLYDLVFFRPLKDAVPGRNMSAGENLFAWSRRGALYLGLASTWLVLAWLVVQNPRAASVGVGVQGWSSWLYFKTQCAVVVHYLRLAFVPWPLCLDYGWPPASSLVRVLPQMLLLASLAGLTIWGLVRLRAAAFAGTWFFLILAPTSTVVPIATEVAAEHRMYLPLAGVVAMVVVGGYAVLARWLRLTNHSADTAARPHGPWRPMIRAVLVVISALAVAGCVSLTQRRNADYRSAETIWAADVAHRPLDARARNNYGAALLRDGRFAEAERQLREALVTDPNDGDVHCNLGIALCNGGRYADGIEHLQMATRLKGNHRNAYYNLGEALAAVGHDREALDAYRRALQASPGDVAASKSLAWLLATGSDNWNDGQESVSLARLAVSMTHGQDSDALQVLAAAYARRGDFPDAMSAARDAQAVAARRGDTAMERKLAVQLALYRAGQRLRRTPAVER